MSLDEGAKRADQDGEYLNEAHGIIADTLDGLLEETGFGHDYATAILDALGEAGWHLLTFEDTAKLLAAYTLQSVRTGNYTVTDHTGIDGGGHG